MGGGTIGTPDAFKTEVERRIETLGVRTSKLETRADSAAKRLSEQGERLFRLEHPGMPLPEDAAPVAPPADKIAQRIIDAEQRAEKAEGDVRALLAAARDVILEGEHPSNPSIDNWAWQIRNFGEDRRACYRLLERELATVEVLHAQQVALMHVVDHESKCVDPATAMPRAGEMIKTLAATLAGSRDNRRRERAEAASTARQLAAECDRLQNAWAVLAAQATDFSTRLSHAWTALRDAGFRPAANDPQPNLAALIASSLESLRRDAVLATDGLAELKHLRDCLAAVIPYAETRAEDMSDSETENAAPAAAAWRAVTAAKKAIGLGPNDAPTLIGSPDPDPSDVPACGEQPSVEAPAAAEAAEACNCPTAHGPASVLSHDCPVHGRPVAGA